MGWSPTWHGHVEPDWLDELGHVNFLAYQRIADKGAGVFWADMWSGCSAPLVETVNMAFDLKTRRAMIFPANVKVVLAARGPRPVDARSELPLKRLRNET